jgi:hypothetical protein
MLRWTQNHLSFGFQPKGIGVAVTSRELKAKQAGKRVVAGRPLTTYDSGYEHSLEHWLELQDLVEAEEEEEHPAARYQAG